MTDLERIELALRRVQAQRKWETSTIAEFIEDLVIELTGLNTHFSPDGFERGYLEDQRNQ